MSKTLGKEVRYRQVKPEEWVQIVFGGESEFAAQHLAGIVKQHERGDMAGINDVVEKITGHKPESVAEFVERNRQAFE